MTILYLSFNGPLGKDLNVFLPITTILPVVVFLKNFMSSGIWNNKLLFFPTTTPSSKECIWVCYNNVDRYVKTDNKDYTIIYFKGGKVLNIKASYTTIDNQITRCIRIEKYLADRTIKNY